MAKKVSAEALRKKTYKRKATQLVSEEEIVKQRRYEKRVEKMRYLIMDLGDVAIAMYIGISSIVITYLMLSLLYIRQEQFYLEYLVTHPGSDLVAEFFLVGIFLTMFWVFFGVLCVWMYRSFLELQRKGYRKKKGWLNEIMKVKEKK